MKPEKRMQHLFLPLLFLLVLTPCLEAQNKTDNRIVRLLWSRDSYALNYEILIEAVNDDGNRQVMRGVSTMSYLEVTLPPGNYRFRVIPYDFLEKPGTASRWVSFEVKRAAIPKPPPIEITGKPETPEIDMKRKEIAGEALHKPENAPEPAKTPEPVYVPEPVYAPEPENAPEPSYASEPASEPKPASIRKISPYLSAAWMPIIPIYGDRKNYYLGEKPALIGTGARFGILFLNAKFFKPGVELSGSWYKYDLHTFTAGLNMVVQKDFSKYMALRLNLGAGVLYHYYEIYIHSNLGLLFLVYPHKHFYFEAGFEYTHTFAESSGDNPGCIRPVLGLGWQI